MMSYEGVDIARRLNAMGVDAFILKYRLLYTGPDASARRHDSAAASNRNAADGSRLTGALQGPVWTGPD